MLRDKESCRCLCALPCAASQTDELQDLGNNLLNFLLILVNKDLSFSNKFTISYNEDYLSLFSGGL
jgi:hypothetical protein